MTHNINSNDSGIGKCQKINTNYIIESAFVILALVLISSIAHAQSSASLSYQMETLKVQDLIVLTFFFVVFCFFVNSKVAKSFYNKIIRTLLFLLAVDLSNCSLTLVKSKILEFEKDNSVAITNTNPNTNSKNPTTTTHSEGSIIDTDNDGNIDDANIDDGYEADVSDD